MHGSLMNVSAIREGERKRMKRERLEGGEEGGIPEHKATRGGGGGGGGALVVHPHKINLQEMRCVAEGSSIIIRI